MQAGCTVVATSLSIEDRYKRAGSFSLSGIFQQWTQPGMPSTIAHLDRCDALDDFTLEQSGQLMQHISSKPNSRIR